MMEFPDQDSVQSKGSLHEIFYGLDLGNYIQNLP